LRVNAAYFCKFSLDSFMKRVKGQFMNNFFNEFDRI
jgi:hypothetical protein